VGGDFYDVIDLGDGSVGVVIADVSDKGMAAALYMALARSLLLAEARRERSPSAVLHHVNRLLQELGAPGMFVSIFYGVLSGDGKRLRYSRAGHDRPFLLRDGATIELGGRGALLGVFDDDDLHLTEEEIGLALGDRLILYTDGLTDMVDETGEMYGADRLSALATSLSSLPLVSFCEAVFSQLLSYCECTEQFDDMTALVMDVVGAGV
jgi:sigma-B regulation protein RsbU (phosphoserine phosphatase)